MTKTTAPAPEVAPLVYTKAQLPTVVGLSKATIDNMRKKNEFPAPVVLGGRKVGWPVETIKAWLAARPTATGIYG